MSGHKTEAILGGLALGALGAATGGFGLLAAPAVAAGEGAAAAGSGGLLGALGGFGGEQAAALAAQNAGLGFGADLMTLDAAGTPGMGLLSSAVNGGNASNGLRALSLANSLQPQQRPPSAMVSAPPQPYQPPRQVPSLFGFDERRPPFAAGSFF